MRGNVFSAPLPACEVLLIPDAGEGLIFTYSDHFINGSSPGYINYAGNSGTGSGAAYSNTWSDQMHPGIASLTTGTANAGYAFITSGQTFIVTSGAMAFRAVVYTGAKSNSTAATYAKIFVGLGTQGGSSDADRFSLVLCGTPPLAQQMRVQTGVFDLQSRNEKLR